MHIAFSEVYKKKIKEKEIMTDKIVKSKFLFFVCVCVFFFANFLSLFCFVLHMLLLFFFLFCVQKK